MPKEYSAKPYAVSKHVVYVCKMKAGSSWDTTIRRNGWRYYVGGNTKITLDNGNTINLLPKMLLEDFYSSPKTLNSLVLEDTEWVCYSDYENKAVVIPECFYFNKDETFALHDGEDLFLVKGTLNIDGKEHIGPKTIRIRNKDTIGTPITECYTLKFNE